MLDLAGLPRIVPVGVRCTKCPLHRDHDLLSDFLEFSFTVLRLTNISALFIGYRPFTDDNFNTFVEMATTMNNKVREHCDSPEYAILFQVRDSDDPVTCCFCTCC